MKYEILDGVLLVCTEIKDTKWKWVYMPSWDGPSSKLGKIQDCVQKLAIMKKEGKIDQPAVQRYYDMLVSEDRETVDLTLEIINNL